MQQPSDPVDQAAVIDYVVNTFAGIEVLRPTDGLGAGDTFIYYDPRRDLDPARRLPFATIVTKDYGEADNASQLDRPDVFRLNLGVSRDAFRALFGHLPGDDDSPEYDFAALDHLMPHPVYGRQFWICVLNPSPDTFERVKPLLADAYATAAARLARRQTHRE